MRVAIIGAGIAGLTAARELSSHGINVEVFEKSRGVGGRLANARKEWAQVDIGAQYFTARDERFKHQIDAWLDRGVVAEWTFNPHVFTDSKLAQKPSNVVRYVGVPKMNSIAHDLAQNISITFQTKITKIVQQQKHWTLIDESSGALENTYDWVVLSLPAEQTKALLDQSNIKNAIPERVHDACWALALATRGNIARNVQGIFGDNVVSWATRLSSRPQRIAPSNYDDLWMLHFSSTWSNTHPKESRPDIVKIGQQWLSNALAEHAYSPLHLEHSHQHYWRFARLKDETKRVPSPLIEENNALSIIGDWTQGGRIEGAYLSAIEFVERFLKVNSVKK